MESCCTAGTPVPQVFLISNLWAYPTKQAAMLRSFAISLLGAPGRAAGAREYGTGRVEAENITAIPL